MRRIFKTRLLEAIHETARAQLRRRPRPRLARASPSQPNGIAKVLNADLATVRRWEIGERRPSGPYCKLLDLLERKGVEGLL